MQNAIPFWPTFKNPSLFASFFFDFSTPLMKFATVFKLIFKSLILSAIFNVFSTFSLKKHSIFNVFLNLPSKTIVF